MTIDLDEIKKHMAARDHLDLLTPEAQRMAQLALMDDVPGLVAEIERLYEVAKQALDRRLADGERWAKTADAERERAEGYKEAVKSFLYKIEFIPSWQSADGEWAAATKRLHDSVLVEPSESFTK